ncbi:LOW QUALITY PROTEIN: uncharacterized protein [Macrobrachium rosenbergii]|uniref:LOW QUALITY PROTEIN: uncharacterized protein n=1 Tax=Macrobrachium rosenbergii TaxID=79674 RepID=UPI0034D65022
MFELHRPKYRHLMYVHLSFGLLISTDDQSPSLLSGHTFPTITLGPADSVCYPNDLPLNSEAFTVCAFVRPMNPTEGSASSVSPEPMVEASFDGVLFTLLRNGTLMEARFLGSRLVVAYGERSFTLDASFEAGVWRRVCLRCNLARLTVEATLDHHTLGILEAQPPGNDTKHPTRELCLGSRSGDLSSFTGSVAGFFLMAWNPSLTPAYPVADCSRLVPEEALVEIGAGWDIQGNAALADYDVATLCGEAYVPVVIRMFTGFRPHLDLCLSMGGRFVTGGELKDDLLESVAKDTESCELHNDRVFWYGDQPPRFDIQTRCPAALPGSTESSQRCITELNCSVCVLPANITYTLYGGIFAMDWSYTLLTLDGGNFYFKGEDSSEIRYNGSHWTLASAFHSDQWVLLNSFFPVGRNEWQMKGITLNATLTQCSQSHFACPDGTCIAKESLCDGIENCKDGDDEAECGILWTSDGYERATSPSNDGVIHPFLYYAIGVSYVSDISTDDGAVEIEFDLRMSWYDSRVKYQNLKSQANYFPCEDVWNPRLIAMAGYGSGHKYQLDTYTKECAVLDGYPKPNVDFMDPRMGKFLGGDKHQLSMMLNSYLKAPCNFRLDRYPFGTYVCNITLRMTNGGRGTRLRARSPGNTLVYAGSTDLLEFRLTKLTYETLDDSSVTLTLHLISLYEFHVLNSFAPSSLMFLICLATFFFPIDSFNERIMVSLTALLVLAALFTQGQQSSVKTAYYKLLDVWYAALIGLCFSSVIMIACVNAIFIRKTRDLVINIQVKPALENSASLSPVESTVRKAEICNTACIVVLISLFVLLTAFYCLIAGGAV